MVSAAENYSSVFAKKTEKIFQRPYHPYTEALLSAIPKRESKGHRKRAILSGDIPSPVNPPPGCVFHTRCKYAQEMCKQEVPQLRVVEGEADTQVACHFADELNLTPYMV